MSEIEADTGLIRGIDHLAVAVQDLQKSAESLEKRGFGSAKGEEIVAREQVVLKKNVRGSLTVELISPYQTDNSGLARFIKTQGEGLHHVAIECEDLPLCLNKLANSGIKALPNYPAGGSESTTVAFLKPGDTGGLLIELVERNKVKE